MIAAAVATTIQARAVSEAPIPAPSPPWLSIRSSGTPASAAACIATIGTAAPNHTSASRSTTRCARNADGSRIPASSGRAVMRISTSPPRQTAPANPAVKWPSATGTVAAVTGKRPDARYAVTATAAIA